MTKKFYRAIIRPATPDDLPALVDIHNHYVVNTHVTFDVEPFTVASRRQWFDDNIDGKRHPFTVSLPVSRSPTMPPTPSTSKLGFTPLGTFAEVGIKYDKYWNVAWFECDLASMGERHK
jgi:L-amino acid N-acyltransferase YncA